MRSADIAGSSPPWVAQYIRVYITLNTAIRNAIGVQDSELKGKLLEEY